ncbi:aldo/keto reductase, partial [Helicosporidium sp. ATCC 50920]
QADAAALPFLLPNCKNVDAECDTWRSQGECEANPGYMSYNCMLACGVCHTAYLHAIPRSLPIAEGVWMPTIGFGTAALGDRTADAVESALKAGYRLLDSAQAREWYREDLVGAGLAASGVDREEVFLTTKIHPRNLGYWATLTAFDDSLRDLRTDYVDLVLLHYPECSPSLCGNGVLPEGDFKESWAALEQLVDEKRVRAIGVSNFNIQQLSELLRTARIRPALLQARSDVLRAGRENWAWCRRHNITFQGYSTLGTQHGGAGNPVLEHPLLRDVARAKARAPAQVALRWALGHGQAVVPRASSKGHLAQNLVADSFDLTDQEMQDLDALDGTSPRVEQ